MTRMFAFAQTKSVRAKWIRLVASKFVGRSCWVHGLGNLRVPIPKVNSLLQGHILHFLLGLVSINLQAQSLP